MPCYHPLDAWQDNGTGAVFFGDGDPFRCTPLNLPCGQCIGCRLDKTLGWTVRIMHEAQSWPMNRFVTLTYDDDNLPDYGSLRKKDFQLFMKRLRKAYGANEDNPIRFYQCGEYGDKLERPHHHACLFNIAFEDERPYKEKKGYMIRTSKILDLLWGHGKCTVGDLTSETAAYTARYVTKKVTGEKALDHYERTWYDGAIYYLEPEYATMSLKPGIGSKWWEQYKDQLIDWDDVILNGRSVKPPRYYDKKLEIFDGLEFERIKTQRKEEISKHLANCTPARLQVREQVTLAKLDSMKRNLEG